MSGKLRAVCLALFLSAACLLRIQANPSVTSMVPANNSTNVLVNSTIVFTFREALIKASFSNFDFYGMGKWSPQRKISSGVTRSQTVSSQNLLVGRLFSPLHEVGVVVFQAVACRAPIITLTRPKSV